MALRFLLALTLAFTLSPARAELLSYEEYTETRALALEILRRYPPTQYHYVGLGRSPTPLMAFLQALDPRMATNLPGTTMSLYYQWRDRLDQPPQDRVRDRAFAHFDRMMPSDRELNGKKILLVDFVRGGESLKGAFGVMSLWASRFRPSLQIRGLGLVAPDKLDTQLGPGIDRIDLVHSPHLVSGMNGMSYEPLAEYPMDWRPMLDDPKDLQKGKEYRTLLAQTEARIARDGARPMAEIRALTCLHEQARLGPPRHLPGLEPANGLLLPSGF